MMEIERIVAPINFSQYTDPLIEYTVRMAEELSAAVYFIHVIDFSIKWAMIESPQYKELKKNLHDAAKANIKSLLANHCRYYHQCHSNILFGEPVDQILFFAKNIEANMVIIGTYDFVRKTEYKLGTVAKRVLKKSSCPVLLFNPHKKRRGMTKY